MSTDETAQLRSSLAYWQTGAINWEARALEAEKTITSLQERLDAAEAERDTVRTDLNDQLADMRRDLSGLEDDLRLANDVSDLALKQRDEARAKLAASEAARERLVEEAARLVEEYVCSTAHLGGLVEQIRALAAPPAQPTLRTSDIIPIDPATGEVDYRDDAPPNDGLHTPGIIEGLQRRAPAPAPPAQPPTSEADAQIANQTPLGEWATRVAAASRQATLQELRQRFRAEHLIGFLDLLDDENFAAQPPASEAACPRCNGKGKIVFSGPHGERNIVEPCPVCRGSGKAKAPAPSRDAVLAEARQAVAMSAWKHVGNDAYSQGMDAGARHQVDQCLAAIAALKQGGQG